MVVKKKGNPLPLKYPMRKPVVGIVIMTAYQAKWLTFPAICSRELPARGAGILVVARIKRRGMSAASMRRPQLYGQRTQWWRVRAPFSESIIYQTA
jgi:hypothetical protein